jgi:hypothetical protein
MEENLEMIICHVPKKHLLKKVLNEKTNKSVAELFIKIYLDNDDKNIVSISTDTKPIIYNWNPNTTLYEKINKNDLIGIVQITIDDYIRGEKRKIKGEELKKYNSVIIKIGSNTFISSTADIVIGMIKDNEFIKKVDVDPDVVNFKNKIVNLKTGHSRYRKITDLYTKTLDYDYHRRLKEGEKPDKKKIYADEEKIKFIEDMYSNICNDDHEDTECTKEFFGYCLTGRTDQQRCFWSIGPTASNGKSKLVEAFINCMKIYCTKLNSRTFDPNYSKNHKQMVELYLQRFAYLEEMWRKNIDVDLLKDIVNGVTIGNVEIMYGTVKDIKIYFKLYVISNYDPTFINDNGMQRRGYLLNHTNKFVSEVDYKQLEDKTGHYIKDTKFGEKFLEDEYKLAIFHVLLPYAKKYYEDNNEMFTWEEDEKIVTSTKFEDAWKVVCKENDRMADFIEKFYTKDKKSMVSKDSIYENYQKYYGATKWKDVLGDLKRLGYSYDCQKMCEGAGNKGTFYGIKYNGIPIKKLTNVVVDDD